MQALKSDSDAADYLASSPGSFFLPSRYRRDAAVSMRKELSSSRRLTRLICYCRAADAYAYFSISGAD